VVSVKGRIRLPCPAASIIAFMVVISLLKFLLHLNHIYHC
jgi:hypothetical protein